MSNKMIKKIKFVGIYFQCIRRLWEAQDLWFFFSVINERWREDRDRTAINLIKNKLYNCKKTYRYSFTLYKLNTKKEGQLKVSTGSRTKK